MAATVTAKHDGNTYMQTHKTYSLADLEGALRACNYAIVQTRRGHGGPILTLKELKTDAEALSSLVAKARAEPSNSLRLHELGDILPRLTYWHQRDIKTPVSRSEFVKTSQQLP
jgi:hypothetical protein